MQNQMSTFCYEVAVLDLKHYIYYYYLFIIY